MLSNQQHVLCAYRNPEKSRVSPGNPRGVDWCDFENKPIDKGMECSAGDDIKNVVEIVCKKCKKVLCQYKVVPGHGDTDLDGIVDFRYTEHLASYRKRPDGALGLECLCGETDTRLADIERKQTPEKFPAFVPDTPYEVAVPGHKKSQFRYNKRVDRNAIKDRGLHGKIEVPTKKAKP